MKGFCSLLKKDVGLMASGKFFLMSLGFLILYTLYVNFGYVRFVNAQLFHVYLYDPAGTQETVSPQVRMVSGKEGIYTALRDDDAGIGIDASTGKPELIFYEGKKRLTDFGLIMPILPCSRQWITMPKQWVPIRRSKRSGRKLLVNCCFLKLQPLDF